jgi:hypothetical protein
MSWIIAKDEKNGLLDTFSGAAAAYSLRNLQGRSGKDSAIVRVRRSSDNTESDFTATEVSDGTLAAWVGAGNNGFVPTWYDQSGNGRHATQASTARQPQIVSNGVLLAKNLRPTINFDGSDDFLTNTTAINQQITLFIVCSTDITPPSVPIVAFDGNTTTTSRNIFSVNNTTRNLGMFAGVPLNMTSAAPAVDTLFLGYGLFNTTQSEVAFNGLVGATGNAGSQVLDLGWRIGAERALVSGFQWDGKISEVVFWAANQSSNRVGIEANINAHYSIY